MEWSGVECSGVCSWDCYKTLTFFSLLARCRLPCACHAKRHLNVQSVPYPAVFCTFDFELCFAPQRRALFRRLNFQKWSGAGVFCSFWLGNVLRATMACTFFTSQIPKVVRTWCVLQFCTFWLRHVLRAKTACTFSSSQLPQMLWTRGVITLVFSLAHVLRATTACNSSSLIWPDGSASAALASLLFDPPEPQIIGKTWWIAALLPFRAPASSFFWLFLFSDLLSSSLLFSDSSHLCFSICPYCRKFDF